MVWIDIENRKIDIIFWKQLQAYARYKSTLATRGILRIESLFLSDPIWIELEDF